MLAFAAIEVFFTPGVTFVFFSLFDLGPAAIREAILIATAGASIKLTIILLRVAKWSAPITRWLRDTKSATEGELIEASVAAYEAPVSLGAWWSLLWFIYLSALATFVGAALARAGAPVWPVVPIFISVGITVLLGASTLAAIIGGFLFAPPAGQLSVEAHHKNIDVPAKSTSLQFQLGFLSFGLALAPTFWLTSYAMSILLKTGSVTGWNIFLLLICFLLPLVFGVLGAIALSKMFFGSIRGVGEVLRQVAESGGKLDGIGRVPVYFRNEFGELAERANVMVARLAEARSELEAAHAAQIRAEKLASIGQLAATLGHDLRNPLAAVRNAQQYIALRLAKQPQLMSSEPRLQQMLDVASRELEGASRQISDLLDYLREKPPVLEPCPLRPMVADAIGLVPPRANITVENNVPEDLPVPRIDREQFRRLVINLVQNAVEVFPQQRQGKVRVEGAHLGARGWRLSILDDGPGIPPDALRRIFEPLFTTKNNGTGLGLVIVDTIVKRHGGTISVESVLGRGTEFHVDWRSSGELATEKEAVVSEGLVQRQ